MRQREINITGRITSEGKLAMYMQELNSFSQQWKNARIVATFKVYQPGSSAALRGYYFNCIIPNFRRAFWENGERLTEKETEIRCRWMSPITVKEIIDNNGKYIQDLKEIIELSNAELCEYIEHLKEIAATEFFFYIEDPSEI